MSLSERFRILIADDSDVCRTVLAILLKNSGFDVTSVINGREALAKLGTQRFDLAIFDHDMPELNGLETLTALRGFDTQLPVAIVSGRLSAAIRERYDQLHIVAAFDKPVDPRKLRENITGILEHQLRSRQVPPSHSLAPFPLLEGADAALEKPVFAGASSQVRKLLADFGRIREFRAAATIVGGPDSAYLDVAVALGEARDALPLACDSKRLDADRLERHLARAGETGQTIVLIVTDAEALSRAQQELVESFLTGPGDFTRLAILCTRTDLNALADAGRFDETLAMRAGVMRISLPALAQRRSDLALMARAVFRRIGASGAELAPGCRTQIETLELPGDYRQLHRVVEIAHRLHPRLREFSMTHLAEALAKETEWKEPLYHDVLRATLEGE